MKQESINKLKQDLIDTYKKLGDKKALLTKGRSYTGNELADEIEKETDFGLGLIESIIHLTINLLSRDKINL